MSSMGSFGLWDYVVFIVVLVISAGIGIFHGCGGKQKTTSEFLMANREMSILPIALSMLASFMSAITVLGVPAEIYRFGTQFMMISVAYAMLMPFVAFLVIPVFYNLNLTSMYEYLEIRFGKPWLKLIGSVTFIVQMTLYMAIALYAPCLALNAVMGLNVWVSVFSVGIVCTFYTTLGGMKAVMWTDVFQVTMMITGILTVLIKGCIDLGGLSAVWTTAQEGGRIEFFNTNPDPRLRNTLWTATIGGFFQWVVIYGGNQSQVQRCLASPTLKNAQIAMLINAPGLIVLNIMTGLCGLVCYAYYRQCDPLNSGQIQASDQVLPLFVMEAINIPGVPGLFVACVLSAALSTISSGLNSLSAVTTQDIILRRWPDLKERSATNCTKLLAFAYGVLMMAFAVAASQLGSVLQMALSLFSMTGAPLFGMICLGMYFPMANWKGSFVGWLVSLLFQFWLVIGTNIVQPYQSDLPRSTEGCVEGNSTVIATNYTDSSYTLYVTAPSYMTNTTDIAAPTTNEDMFYNMYSISYLWYSILGITITVLVGLIVSILTGGEDIEKIDPRAFLPICDRLCGCLPASVRRRLRCNVNHDTDNDKGQVDSNIMVNEHASGEPLMLHTKALNAFV